MQYITTKDVDDALGPDWADDGDKARNVAMANAYMSSLNLTFDIDDIPSEVKREVKTAGAELAAAAAEGDLFKQHSQGAMTSETAKAGSVESQVSYAALDMTGTTSQSPRIQFALALLGRFMSSAFSFPVGRCL
ncbi:DnaT-like ssDNA-binding protein [Carnimonas bestiolae]|uniref:DnaT-like ssDNA-binding protein n=1 Tax=Carnimonas bestiolae TaxID=3402172 RepID=UPI003EDC9202